MFNVTEKCCCGATINIVDENGSYITHGGDLDKFGDKFVWQKALREFRDKHNKCLKTSEHKD